MNVSIIICTRDRADSLRETVRAILNSGAVDADCELLLIDNGSTDDTSRVLSETWPDPARARYFLEPRSGKGYAYNHALRAARGRVLLFTDDDVRPPVGWVGDMSVAILEGHTDALQGGVRIAASALKPWMGRRHRQMLASTEFVNPENPEGLVGANMAIGRHVFDRIPGFDVELGPGAIGFGDETLVGLQMREAGLGIESKLGCAVEHCPDVTRLQAGSWVDRAVRQGKSEAYIAHHWSHQNGLPPTVRHQLGQIYWTGRRLLRSLTGAPPGDAELQFIVAHTCSTELLRLHGSPRNYEHHGLIKLRGKLDMPAPIDAMGESASLKGTPAR